MIKNDRKCSKRNVKTHNRKGQLCVQTERLAGLCWPFVRVLWLLLLGCSEGGAARIDIIIFFVHLSVRKTAVCHLSTLSLLFWRSPGEKKSALGCFHIGGCCSVISVAKKMLKYHGVCFFFTATFHISSTATCLSDGAQCDGAYFSFVAVTGRDELWSADPGHASARLHSPSLGLVIALPHRWQLFFSFRILQSCPTRIDR